MKYGIPEPDSLVWGFLRLGGENSDLSALHGGNLYRLSAESGRPSGEIIDFSANINPLGPPEWLRPLISSQIHMLAHYPDPECTQLMEAAALRYGVPGDEILFGNGSSEIIHCLTRIIDAKHAVITTPSYSDYAQASRLAGLNVASSPLRRDRGFALDTGELETRLQDDEIVFIGQPNNPTGTIVKTGLLRELAGRHPGTTFIIDEAFADFVSDMESIIVDRPMNVVVLRSLTKFYAIPGLRLGCAIGEADLVQRAKRHLPPWSVNTLAQAVGTMALADRDYAIRSRELVDSGRNQLINELGNIPGIELYEGKANFLLARINLGDIDAHELARRLIKEGIAIRVCDNFEGLDNRFFRVAVRTEAENALLIRSMRTFMGVPAHNVPQRKKPAIMFQGTSSNAGKSVLTAGLCRVLLQDGYNVAPFKAQNMSLNSYVTHDNGEMGRAQVVQAQACRIDADTRMNPVLIKPNSDTNFQIIIRGKPEGNMDFGAYTKHKAAIFEEVKKSYDSLASEYDVLVLEGAGSPGEVNLKSRDIVNMNMARYAQAPVLLVGDIDRGGVYASYVGTMEVLSECERAQIAGFIVNRFRGTASLLEDAHDYILRHTGRPVLGVVPYLRDLGLPEEDSVSFKAGFFDKSIPEREYVDIALVDLPHISNFTDFDSLRVEPDVRLRIIRTASELGTPNAVIIPGSKNVLGDLLYLQNTGLQDKLMDLARTGRVEIVGVCGGYQILGRDISDPYCIESTGQTLPALGLLPVSTVLAPEKTLACVSARHLPTGARLKGYEIHHGVTDHGEAIPYIEKENGEQIGSSLKNGLIWGTYLHGVFDADEFRRWFIDKLRVRRGLDPIGHVCAVYDIEPALDRLANVVRESMDLNKIYRIMGLC
jgi:adenosylcobyric acid synthase